MTEDEAWAALDDYEAGTSHLPANHPDRVEADRGYPAYEAWVWAQVEAAA